MPWQTPTSIRPLRQFVRELGSLDKNKRVKQLTHAAEKFTAEANIARHEAKGLRMTVIMLKRKQRKGVRLNLFDGESARPLLVSPNKLSQLKEELAAKKTKKQREEEEKELRKNRAEEERKRKEAEKQERSVQNQVNVQLRRERKKLEDDQKAVRKSEREAKKTKKASIKISIKRRGVKQKGGVR